MLAMQNFENTRKLCNHLLNSVTSVVNEIGVDIRDPFPSTTSSYKNNDVLANSDFSCVRNSECRSPYFNLIRQNSRRCVVKIVCIQKRLESILFTPDTGTVSSEERARRYIRRTLTDIYVLCRLKHANLLHAHAAFMVKDELHLVTPRFYTLADLAEMHYEKFNGEPWSIGVMARILRQACLGLDYLSRAGIIHRDVSPENIFITRRGTVKIAHFGQAKIFSNNCVTPVGKETFMAFEKLHNLEADDVANCLPYGETADTWSLGVILIELISPDETMLPTNFAITMARNQMQFRLVIASMLKLRARIVRAGGDELKNFLSDEIFVVDPVKRPTPGQLLNSKQLKKWCSPEVASDSEYIRKKLIMAVDFGNQQKTTLEAPNLECLESKPIPPEFYWDNTWKKLEDQYFSLCIDSLTTVIFRWGDPGKLLKALEPLLISRKIEFSDFCLIEPVVDVLAFYLMKQLYLKGTPTFNPVKEDTVILPPNELSATKRSFVIKLTVIEKPCASNPFPFSESDDESDGN